MQMVMKTDNAIIVE